MAPETAEIAELTLNKLRAVHKYEVYLYYYWLHSPELAISRVAQRVASGGHFVPDDTIRQRYSRSVRNFFELYRQQADYWEVTDNSYGQRKLIAVGSTDTEVYDSKEDWSAFQRSTGDD